MGLEIRAGGVSVAGGSWVSAAVTTGQGQATGTLRGQSAVLLGEPQEGAQARESSPERNTQEGEPISSTKAQPGTPTGPCNTHGAEEERVNWN